MVHHVEPRPGCSRGSYIELPYNNDLAQICFELSFGNVFVPDGSWDSKNLKPVAPPSSQERTSSALIRDKILATMVTKILAD